MTQGSTVHVRRTIVVEYDVEREEYVEWDSKSREPIPFSDDEIREEETGRGVDVWYDLGPGLITSQTTEVTFK